MMNKHMSELYLTMLKDSEKNKTKHINYLPPPHNTYNHISSSSSWSSTTLEIYSSISSYSSIWISSSSSATGINPLNSSYTPFFSNIRIHEYPNKIVYIF